MEASSSPDGPRVPPGGKDIIPPFESPKGPTIKEIMRGHMGVLTERNRSVDGQLLADIGVGESRALIAETPVIEGTDSYSMVVTEDGIMAIQASGKNSKGINRLGDNIRNVMDGRYGTSPGGGYERRQGSNTANLTIPGGGAYSLHVEETGSTTDMDDFRDIKLIVSPSEELVTKMTQKARDRFTQLSQEKGLRDQATMIQAEKLRQI